MKIENKLILSNVMNGAFIILIGFFAIQNMNLVLTKLRFVEIADDLNASFLEMRRRITSCTGTRRRLTRSDRRSTSHGRPSTTNVRTSCQPSENRTFENWNPT